jgi:hypothetical protein
VIDKASGRVAGRQTLMRIDPANGVIEIGNIYWGPLISAQAGGDGGAVSCSCATYSTSSATAATSGNATTATSRRSGPPSGSASASRACSGSIMIIKGESRDTAWYSIIDTEWPALKQAYEGWLSPDNFDSDGNQKRRLEDFRKSLA